MGLPGDEGGSRGSAMAGMRGGGWGRRIGGVVLLGTALAGAAATGAGAEPVTERGSLEHPVHNYRFRQPGGPWSKWDASRVNPAATLAFVRTGPLAFFSLASEEVGVANPVDLEVVANLVETTLDAQGQRRRREDHLVNGMRGVRLAYEHHMAGQSFQFVTWVTLQNGFAYQLSAWAPTASSTLAEVIAMADELFEGFELLDAKRVSTVGGQPVREYRSERYGYAVELREGSWRAWKDLATDFGEADFGVLSGEHAALVVVPLRLLGQQPSLDALAAGLTSGINGIDLGSARLVSVEDQQVLEVDYEALVGVQRFRYRGRVLQRGGVAMLVLAWASASLGEEAEQYLGQVANVRFAKQKPEMAKQNADTPKQKPEAADVAGFDARERGRHALAFNQIGLHYYRRGQRPEAADWFGLSVSVDPTDPTVFQNLAHVQIELGRGAATLDILGQHAELVGKDAKLLSYRALALETLGRSQEAIDAYAEALDRGLEDPEADARYVDLLLAAGEGERAATHLDARVEATGSAVLRNLRAQVSRETGDVEGSVTALEELRSERPRDVEVLYQLVESYSVAGRHEEAIRTTDEILEIGGPTSLAHYLKSRSQFELGWYKEAKASLEAALVLEPESEAAQEFLRHVSGVLGEGENSLVKREVAPVELPEDLLEFIAKAEAPADAAEYGSYTRHYVMGIHYERGKERRSTTWWSAKALDASGVEQLSSVEMEFDPLFEEIFINSLVVRDADGTEVSRARASDSYVLDPPEGQMATSSKRLHVPVRGLEPGMTLELVVSRRERSPPEAFSFVDYRFSRISPVSRAALFVAGDVQELAHDASESVQMKRADARIEWRIEKPTPYQWEPFQPSHTAYLPGVRIADGRDAWDRLAREYLAEIDSYLAPSAEVKKLAQEQTARAEGADEKARALALYVQGMLNYKAIEFGRRARIPTTAPETIERRYGDCKDHAVLLHQLLASAGVRSRLALASLGSEVDPALPSLDQFDHMIVHCLDCEQIRYLDATDKNLALGRNVPRGLGGHRVLILDREAPRLAEIPEPAEERHSGSSDRTVDLLPSGSLVVAEKLELHGYLAALMRDFLRQYDPAQWKEAILQAIRVRDGNALIRDVEVERLEQTDLSLGLALRYEIESGFSRVTSGLVGRLPMIWETEFLGVEPVESRASPFDVAMPIRFSGRVRLAPPAGYTLQQAASVPKATGSGRFTRWSASLDNQAGGLDLRYEIVRGAGHYPPSQYEAFHRETDQAFRFLRQPIELTPTAP